jgi:DNA-binding CsgD family transcriptional regulator
MLENFIDRLRKVETLDELSGAVTALRDDLDIEHVVYHSVNSAGKEFAAVTYEPKWVDRYFDQDYSRIDPVVQSCLRRYQPVDWKHLNWTGKSIKNFMHEAIECGVGHQGFSIPIRGPSGQFALFTVSSRDVDREWQAYTSERRGDLILASHYVNQRALEIERGSDEYDIVSLSPRETDALTLLALGYNRAQASESLSISEHTLRVYIESARFKLSAANTTHAVAKALNQGLLMI